ncbi:helix-turn-helix domain-containing protein [Comamonas piscis]|uniref:Helix-turn-helix domain-containing protein n=1 Tax=Comamonas piscis TaxID=1562974 RepID=A0A7G5EHE7_9BURK|nr:helix-turn-helix domain-containing protein [Comamonas piscis]QMV73422.1 helix-turn-helix domain-containing protein [Comamonas piscis]WSO36228.1 helix-turn-helix domain-containing protein [Comamonas piscis]
MTDSDIQETTHTSDAASGGALSAGDMLRLAREERGYHLPALAAHLKVSVHKLEALEAGEWSVFPDVVFVRALASAVCRVLKIDPAPVLAQLPKPPGKDLTPGVESVKTRVAVGPAQSKKNDFPSSKSFPWMGVVVLLVVATVGVLFYPQLLGYWKSSTAASAPVPVRSNNIAGVADQSEPVALGGSSTDPVPEAPANGAADAGAGAGPAVAGQTQSAAATAVAAAAVPAANAPLLHFKTSQDSWVQIKEASGKVVFEKTIRAGASEDIAATPPLKLIVGNVAGVEMQLRGSVFDLKKVTKGSTARFEVN